MIGSTQINSIELSQKETVIDNVWTPPEDWPNIRKLLKQDDGHGYTYVAYALFDIRYYPSVQFNYPYWITSDGHEYRGNVNHIWDNPNEKYGWVAIYSNTQFTYSQYETSSGNASKRLLWICFNFDIQNCIVQSSLLLQSIECPNILKFTGTGAVRAMTTASSLRSIPNEIDMSGATNCNQMFQNCYALKNIPDYVNLQNTASTANMFANCYMLSKIPDVLNMSNVTDANNMFSNCYSLTNATSSLNMPQVKSVLNMFNNCVNLITSPNDIIMPLCTSCAMMFSGCQMMPSIPRRIILDSCTTCQGMFSNNLMALDGPIELYIPKCTNCIQMFNNCIHMKNLPDILDIGASTNNNQMFGSCSSLESVPTHLTANASISFQHSNLISRDSVATFDGAGNINGGMVYNLNTCSSSGQIITFHSDTKAKFTSDEWTKIKTILSSKNWGCSPA